MFDLHFTQEAIYDIEDAVYWYEEQREGLSYDFELCLEVGLGEIQRSPEAFQKRYKDIKIVFIPRFPYGIHYTVKGDVITIVGIFHSSRSPKNWSKRL